MISFQRSGDKIQKQKKKKKKKKKKRTAWILRSIMMLNYHLLHYTPSESGTAPHNQTH